MSLNQLTHSPKEQSSIYIPPELRTQIFQDLLSIPRNVKIFWSEHTQKFYTNAPIPPLLLVSHDSRLLALSHYTLAFGNPGKCRIFFSYTHDTADFQWSYLARYSGSGVNYEVMRTKLGRGDYDGLRRIRLTERELTGRATDTFVDLRGLEGLSDVFVTCDREEKEVDRGWSEGILGELWKGLEEDVRNWGKGKEKWPRLWCGRCTSEKGESGSECSRHWFFARWNEYAEIGQHRKWAPLLAESLHITRLDGQSPPAKTIPARQLFRRMIERHWLIQDFIPSYVLDNSD